MILTNPTKSIVNEELPILVEQGITSVKLYMTYDRLKLVDRQILDVMMATRALGMTTMMHAENSDMIALITEQLYEQKKNRPLLPRNLAAQDLRGRSYVPRDLYGAAD